MDDKPQKKLTKDDEKLQEPRIYIARTTLVSLLWERCVALPNAGNS